MNLGIWVPFRAGGSLGPPESLPLGRAALAARARGVTLVLGSPQQDGRFDGVVAEPGGWVSVAGAAVDGVYDRFPSGSRPEAFAAGLRALGGIPVANAPVITALCRDKLQCQRALEGSVAMPEVCGEPGEFGAALADWGLAFLKPRHGSFGEGVVQVRPGDPLPTAGDFVLQRAIVPAGAHLALRVLVQRGEHGLVVRSPVARRSLEDPVVNAARGAEVLPAADLELPLDAIAEVARETFRGLAARGLTLELGVDVVLDDRRTPYVIEVNSRPRGRLRELARKWPERFAAEHEAACVAPFLVLGRE